MRKPKHIIAGLALSSLLLVGCSTDLVKSKDGSIVTVTIDGNPVKITASGNFDKYLNTPQGLKDYYDAVYQVVVRALFERSEQATKRAEAYSDAALRVKEVKETAKNNAKGGGKYDDELEKLLEQENVETVKELEEKFAYEKMQEFLKTQFFDGGDSAWITNGMEELIVGEKDANGNLIYEGYLNNKLPYHVRHLLVKVSAESNAFVTGTISSSEANKLSSVITALAEGQDTFGLLANRFSEDEGSAKQFGDLGIMTTSTGYVNEFKLGVYAYDAIYNKDGALTPADRAKLEIPTAAVTSLENLGLGEIPYGAALDLKAVRNKEKDDNGKEVMDGKAIYYPRNILFNKYFNKHNISVITPNDSVVGDEVGVPNAAFAALPRFKAIPELNGQQVLVDEKDNVILVVRAGASGSYEGIHFIVVERSALLDTVNGVTLKDYYTLETPGTATFPKDPVTHVELDTFVNFLNLDSQGTKERIDTIKNEVKSFDQNVNDRIFQKLVDKLNVEFSDASLQTALETYLDNQYEQTQFTQNAELEQLWAEWIEYLEQQQVVRSERLIHETMITHFNSGELDDMTWAEIVGGVI